MRTETTNRITITRGELYAVIAGTFLLIATAVAAAASHIGNWSSFVRSPGGAAVLLLVIALITWPASRILSRAYYGQEEAFGWRSAVWTFVAVAVAFVTAWMLRPF